MTGFAQEQAEQDGEDNTSHPKNTAGPEVGDMILRAGKTLAEQIGEDRANESCDSEGEEVDSSRRAPFDLVRIHFLDDGVRNHRGARSDAE